MNTACAGATGGGGFGGVTWHPTSASAIHTPASAREQRNESFMTWFLIEAGVALLALVAIIAWTLGPVRRREKRDDEEGDGR